MSIDQWLADADALLDNAPLRPDRVHCRLRKERGLRLEVRHRRVFNSEFVVLADVAAGEVEAELLIPRLLVAEVARSLQELDRYLGVAPANVDQQRLF